MFLAPVMASAGQALIQDNGDGTGATVGMVDVSYDGENIAVKFTTEEPYRLLEAHAAAAAECADIPQNKKGNPKVGRFELGWNSPSLAGETEVGLSPLVATSYAPGDVICIAAHAVVYNAEGGETVEEAIENTMESAWADGDLFAGKSWATHFPFEIPPTNATCPCDFAAFIAPDDAKWRPEAFFQSFKYSKSCQLTTDGLNQDWNYIGTYFWSGDGKFYCDYQSTTEEYGYEELTVDEFYACSAAVNAYAASLPSDITFTVDGSDVTLGPCPTEPDP